MADTHDRAGREDPLAPAGWDDPTSGTRGPQFWSYMLETELSRARRYRRPLTIVLVELAGASGLASTWGYDVAREAVVALGKCVAQSVRKSDHIARIAPFQFGLLLTETGEVAAINLIERVREDCPSAMPARIRGQLRLAFGWTSPAGEDTVEAMLGRATRILAGELRE